MPVDDDRLQVPGAFASRGGDGGPNDWTLGKLTHQVGTVKPFVVNYNDGTTERYTAEPRRWGSAT
jgi:hypothetical protein